MSEMEHKWLYRNYCSKCDKVSIPINCIPCLNNIERSMEIHNRKEIERETCERDIIMGICFENGMARKKSSKWSETR